MEIGGVFDFRKIAIRSLSTDENVVLNTMISEIQDLVSNFPPLTGQSTNLTTYTFRKQSFLYFRF